MPLAAEQLTVVIPTRDRWPILARTLDALAHQSVSGFAVVVVVDGEDQQPPRSLPAEVDVLAVTKGGPGAARNQGVARATTPYVMFLGDDMIPAPDVIERHLARLDPEDPLVAVLGHVDWHPEVRRDELLAWIDKHRMQFDYERIEGDDAGWGRFYSCNVSLSVALFDAAGGFDPDFVFYYEDLDLGYRLHQAGMTLTYVRDAVTEHLHQYDETRFAARLRGMAAGERMMAAKHEWFTPWFADRFRNLDQVRRPSALARRLGGAERAERALSSEFAAVYLDAFDGAAELDELKRYLGDAFDESQLIGHRRAVDAEEAAAPDEATFYRTSTSYLYDLTVFAMSGTKRPYRNEIRAVLPDGGRLLDYGCGIGSDGLRFLEASYDVDFVDFDNPSTTYLKWRLAERGNTASRVFDLDSAADRPVLADGRYDLVYCFDVIEHVDDPLGFLAELEATASLVAVNFLEPDADDVHVHKPLPVARLLRHATRQGIVHYAYHYDRSHFVIYRSQPAGPGGVVSGRLRRAQSKLIGAGLPR